MKSNPPPGYVDMKAASKLAGGRHPDTLKRAVRAGLLKGRQTMPKSPWYFRPADVCAWLGIDESANR